MQNKRSYKVIELEKPDWSGDKYTLINDLGKKVISTFPTIEEAQKSCDEYNSTYYLSDYSNDEILAYFNSIDFKPLFDKINSLIGLELTYDVQIKTDRFGRHKYFEIENKENLVDHFPILAVAWKKFKVSTFNAEICCDKSTGKLSLWCTIDYSYKSHGLGSNGTEIATAWYKEGKWKIKTNKETYDQD